jgi:hypothetical protein
MDKILEYTYTCICKWERGVVHKREDDYRCKHELWSTSTALRETDADNLCTARTQC